MRKYEEGTVAESTDTQVAPEGASVETAEDAGEHVSEYTTETAADAGGERQADRKRARHRAPQGSHRPGPHRPRVGTVADQRPDAGRVLPEQGAPAADQRAVREPGRGEPVRRGRAYQRRRHHRAGGRPAPGHRPGADPGRPRQPASAEAGRFPDARRPGQGAQEVRPEEGAQGASVLQALTS